MGKVTAPDGERTASGETPVFVSDGGRRSDREYGIFCIVFSMFFGIKGLIVLL